MEKKFNDYFKGNEKVAYLIISIAIYFVVYGLVFNDFIYNHDSVSRIYEGMNRGGLESGRFLRSPLTNIFSFGTYSPLNTVMLQYIFIMLSAFVFCKIFEVNSLLQKIIILLTIMSYPIFAFFWFYDNDIWQYSLAFCVSIFAIYFITRNTIKSRIISILLIICFLGIYQAFLSTLTSTFGIYYLYKIYNEDTVKVKEIIINFSLLILAALLYYFFLQFLFFISGISITEYNGGDQIGIVSIITGIPSSVSSSYSDFLNFVFARNELFDSFYNKVFINILLLGAYPLFLFNMIISKRKSSSIISIFIIIILLPILSNSSLFITGSILSYTQFGYLVIILGAILYYLIIFPWKNVGLLVIIIYLYLNIFIVNQMLFIEQSQTEQTEVIGNQIAIDLMSTKGYEAGDEVHVCGSLQENSNIKSAQVVRHQINSHWLNPGWHLSTYNHSTDHILRVLGYDINLSNGECQAISKEQPIYPENGYITEYDNIFYIKLGLERV